MYSARAFNLIISSLTGGLPIPCGGSFMRPCEDEDCCCSAFW
jgi:hypothetical protein